MTDLEGGALPLVFDSAGFSDIPGAPPFSAYDLAALPVCEAFWLGERPRPAIVLTLICPAATCRFGRTQHSPSALRPWMPGALSLFAFTIWRPSCMRGG